MKNIAYLAYFGLSIQLLVAQDLKVCFNDDGLLGYCNKAGETIIAHTYWDGLPFNSGYAAVRVEDKWGIINEQGRWMVPPTYDKVYNCENIPDILLVKEANEWYFCNSYGISYSRRYEVGLPWYEFDLDGHTAQFKKDALFSVIRKGKWGVVDVNDKIVIPFDYEWLRVIKKEVAGKEQPVSVIFKKKGIYSWQKSDGSETFSFEMDQFLGEYNNLLFFNSTDKSLIINSITGETVTRGDRDFYPLINPRDSIGLVNHQGEIIVPFKYGIMNLNEVQDHVIFGNYEELGLSDLSGNVLLKPIYTKIFELETPRPAIAVRNQESLFAIYTLAGELPYTPTGFKYTGVSFDNGEIKIFEGSKTGTLTLDGIETWE